MKYCCGKSRKGDRANMKSCTDVDSQQTKCACFKLGRTCTRLYRCKNCDNSATTERKFQPKKNRKSCMCGNRRKVDDTEYVAGKDKDQRKSKCPCLRDNLGCTSDSCCRNCGNQLSCRQLPQFLQQDDVPNKRSAEEVPRKITCLSMIGLLPWLTDSGVIILLYLYHV